MFHASDGHVHEQLFRSTAKQLGVVLEGSLRECEGCSVAKGLGKPIGRTSLTKVDKIFGRLFVDSCGETSAASIAGNNTCCLSGITSRASCGCALCVKTSDTVALFESFLADKRLAGTPTSVDVVRSGERGKLKGDFAKLY